ncbi:MAG: monoheme cytochrome SoxX [Thiobacillus sp.]|nr:monoheme cytochrome SoxX [Thiobacillus sp.]
MFTHRLILLATPRHIGVLDWRLGHMHWLGEFTDDARGRAAFHKLVMRFAHLPMLLLVDTVDEDYRSEILPHVRGRARDELLARKLKQVFRNARFTGAWLQSREKAGRRDDRYLLAALTDTDWLVPWLSILHRERIPLYGITPLAMACQHLLGKLRVQEAHVLLAYRLGNSLRLSYYHEGLLRFSRLISGETPTQLPGNAADEIAKTQLYLTGQRILPREARLHVLLLDPSGQLDSAQAPLNADPAFSARLVDLSHLGRALGVPDAFLAATPEIAPLAAIAGEKVALNLAPPELMQRHTEFRWRRNLHTAAGVIALLGLVFTAANWLHAQDLDNQTHELAGRLQQTQGRHQALVASFPQHIAPPEQLAQTVGLAKQLDAAPANTLRLFAAISHALDASPDIKLDALSWSRQPNDQPSEYAVDLDASLASFDGNYRAAMQRIERFMDRLEAEPDIVEVRLSNSPVDTDSRSTLSGKTFGPETADAPSVEFGLSLRYRETPR